MPGTHEEEKLTLSSFLPQGTVIRSLLRSMKEGTCVHAYLISGSEGYGKRTLGRLMAQFFLCEREENRPCGVCAACQQVRSGTHPDLLLVRPGRKISSDEETETGKHAITVTTMREVIARVSTHAYEGRGKVVLIQDAEQMNPQAQNALLKTLEEPPADTYFLLLTQSPGQLLPTVVSRCRPLALHAWSDTVITRVLQKQGVDAQRLKRILYLSEGSVGKAIQLAGDEDYWKQRERVRDGFLGIESRSDGFALAASLREKRTEALQSLDLLEDMLRMLAFVHFGRLDASLIDDYPMAWKRMAQEGNDRDFLHLLDAVSEARNALQRQVNLQAVLERLLLRMMEEKVKW
ncbi:MAG: DNA polymerase III subunit delta' [Clostridia bacterium]|nr:DNA polymerase III subunit delta' [Clostridia bacterium]